MSCLDGPYAPKKHNHPYVKNSELLLAIRDLITNDQLQEAIDGLIDQAALDAAVDGLATQSQINTAILNFKEGQDLFEKFLYWMTYTNASQASSSLTLQNGWQNFGSGLENANYYLYGSRVWLGGVLKTGTLNTTIFTLPAVARPDSLVTLSAMAGYPFQANSLNIQTDGQVKLTNGPTTILYLHGLSFQSKYVRPFPVPGSGNG